jgi:hypothetical protein
VKKWLHRSNVMGRQLIHTAFLRQKGEMRTSRDGNWMAVEAEQHFTVDRPGFIWVARVEAAPFVHLAGRDRYVGGKGHMLIKLLSLYTVADARGDQIDQGSLVRFLSEIIWFPSAALKGYIRWEAAGPRSARAFMRFGGIEGTGLFSFTEDGDMASFEAMRYYDRDGGATLEKWLIRVLPDGYREFDGIRVPAKATVTWRLQDGDFTWFRLEVTELRFNSVEPSSSPESAS